MMQLFKRDQANQRRSGSGQSMSTKPKEPLEIHSPLDHRSDGVDYSKAETSVIVAMQQETCYAMLQRSTEILASEVTFM
jgi:hypothetical protein